MSESQKAAHKRLLKRLPSRSKVLLDDPEEWVQREVKNSQQIMIGGQVYVSQRKAQLKLKITKHTLQKMLKSGEAIVL